MKVSNFLENCKRFLNENMGSSEFYLFDNDNKRHYYIKNVSNKDDEVILELGSDDSNQYFIENLYENFRELNLDTPISVRNLENEEEYLLQDNFKVDDKGKICTEIQELSSDELDLVFATNFVENFSEEEQDEGVFSGRIAKYAKKMGIKLVYLSYWLYYAFVSGLSPKLTTFVVGALGYLLCPIDLISDLIPFIGFSDDATVLIAVYLAIVSNLDPDTINNITQKAKTALRNIFGDFSDDDIKI